jgi:hypothetical protein
MPLLPPSLKVPTTLPLAGQIQSSLPGTACLAASAASGLAPWLPAGQLPAWLRPCRRPPDRLGLLRLRPRQRLLE